MNEYDNPYIMLAHHLLSIHTRAEILRMMTDDEYVLRMIIKEVRGQDFRGPFLDCIIQTILDDKDRMEMCGHLDELSKYFFSRLDMERLREQLQFYGDKYGLL